MIFQNFEHYSLATFIINQSKNNCEWKYMGSLFYFVQFSHKPPVNLSKNLGKRTQTAKNT